MGRFIVKRLIHAIIVLLVVVTFVFILGRLVGDPVSLMISSDATPETVAQLREAYGLDQPLYSQYFNFLGDLIRGDLGESLLVKGYSVGELLVPALLNSIKLATVAIAISIVIGLPLGILAAVNRGGFLDYFARTIAVFGQVVPTWWLGIMLILLFAVIWGVLPAGGIGGIKHYILPATIMGLFAIAGFTRLTRSSMIEILDSEFIKLARAKGLARSKVLWKHALRNALIPVVTFAGMYFAVIITSAVIIEVVFAWPGLGRLMLDALNRRDFPVMQGAILVSGSIVVLFNLTVDILYGWIDPRIRYK
jgi:peptide/nickel transport system permease protein